MSWALWSVIHVLSRCVEFSFSTIEGDHCQHHAMEIRGNPFLPLSLEALDLVQIMQTNPPQPLSVHPDPGTQSRNQVLDIKVQHGLRGQPPWALFSLKSRTRDSTAYSSLGFLTCRKRVNPCFAWGMWETDVMMCAGVHSPRARRGLTVL